MREKTNKKSHYMCSYLQDYDDMTYFLLAAILKQHYVVEAIQKGKSNCLP